MQNNLPQPQFLNCFSTPFVSYTHPQPQRLNQALTALFLEREKEGAKWQEEYAVPTLKVGVYESRFDLFSWPDACVQQLKAFCLACLGQVIGHYNQYTESEMAELRMFNHTWFHITRPGGYMPSHNHPMASWSGVYCVDPGADDPENPDSGVIRFHDPRPGTNMYMDAGNCRLRDEYTTGMRTFKYSAGQFLIFPSSLYHEIAPFTGEGLRITVALNTWTKRVDELNQSTGA